MQLEEMTVEQLIDLARKQEAALRQSLASYGALAMELAAAKVEQAGLVEGAARWNFMMRAADDESGPESKALDTVRIGNQLMESDRKESLQMVELVDQARAAAKEQA